MINAGPKGRKVRAKICQVRGNHVLCATDAAGFPWAQIKSDPAHPPKHLHLEAEWDEQGLLPYSVARCVPEDLSLQLEKTHSDMQLGGSSSEDEQPSVPDLDQDVRPSNADILNTRFNFFYNTESGDIESPDTVWKDFERDLKTQIMKELTPTQLEFVVLHCGSYASKDDFFQSLKGSSLPITLPKDIRSVPNNANSKTTESGRIVQRKLAPVNSDLAWIGTTLEKVLEEIRPSEQVDT